MFSVAYVIILGIFSGKVPHGRVVEDYPYTFDIVFDDDHRPSESIRIFTGPYPWLDEELLS